MCRQVYDMDSGFAHGIQVRKKLKHNCSAIQFPIGLEDQIKGLVDLVHNQAYYFQGAHGYVLCE